MPVLDKGQILFSNNYRITDNISVRHSTVGDIINLGEEKYFGILSTLTSIPSDAKSVLDDMGIDWVEISDLEFFALTTGGLSESESGIFLPNIDLRKFKLYKRPDGDIVYADKDNSIIIDKRAHMMILETLCTIHKIKKKPEKPGSKLARQWLIEEDREKRMLAARKKEKNGFESTLIPLISSAVNSEGFKYNYQTVLDLPYGQFMDAIARLQIIKSADALLGGCYSGNVDMKKLNKKNLDWMREI